MREWNDNFDMKRNVNGKNIIIGQQDFQNETVMIKENSGKIIACPMFFDEDGNLYFIYNNMVVYISEYLGNFTI